MNSPTSTKTTVVSSSKKKRLLLLVRRSCFRRNKLCSSFLRWWLLPTLITLSVGTYVFLITSFITLDEENNSNNSNNINIEQRVLWKHPTTTTREKSNVHKDKKDYDDCWLEPPWGWVFDDDENGHDHNINEMIYSNNVNVCAIRNKTTSKIIRPYTTAKTLTCRGRSHIINKYNNSSTATMSQKSRLNHNEHLNNQDENKITIVLLYYSDPIGLKKQLDNYVTFPSELLSKLTLLVVDDGSPKGKQARDLVLLNNNKYYANNIGMEIRIVRIIPNIPWNMGGAQNLGFYVATTTKVVLLDLDTTIPLETFRRLLTFPLQSEKYPNIIKKFFVVDRLNRTVVHSKLMFLKRDTYWMVGGCDEDFSGHYGHDDTHFFQKCKANHPNCYVAGSMRYTKPEDRLFLTMFDEGDDSTTTATTTNQKQNDDVTVESTTTTQQGKPGDTNVLSFPPKDPSINKKLLDKKLSNYCWSNRYLRFPWTVDL